MPSANDLLFGVRNVFVVSIALLFVSAVLAFLIGIIGGTYPANIAINLCFWAAMVVGTMLTARNARSANSWTFGAVLGVVCGILVIMVSMIAQRLTQADSQFSLQVLIIIPFYAVLGVIGVADGLLRGNRPYNRSY